jgi:DNA-binding ferritin-like protein (Dps family)
VNNFLTKILGDKKEWKAMETRANALPRDYRVVYGEMKSSTTSYMDKRRASLNRDVAEKLAQ